ncbi:MAG: biopolymer transporter ExbD [Kofleriaceae bacterium]
MAGGSIRKRGGIIAEINVTPLVDIMLVLLIIFMLTAHLIAKQAIEVELPRAAAASTAKPTTIAITLTRDGKIYLNEKPVEATALRSAIEAAVKADPKLQTIIAGDKEVSHGRVVWVLDLVKQLGVTSFAIQIDPNAVVPPT